MEPKDLVTTYIEDVWNQGNLTALADLTTPDFTYHLGGQPPRDRSAMAKFLAGTREAFPDWHVDIEDMVGQDSGDNPGDNRGEDHGEDFGENHGEDRSARVGAETGDKPLVAVRWTGTVTHLGPFHGAPATGRRISVSGINVYRLRDGKIAQEWEQMDSLGMLAQLGLLPT